MNCKTYYTKTGKEIRLWQGDCMDLMSSKPENHWDLAIVDPPYGIDAAKRRADTGKNAHIKQKDYKYGDWDKNTPSAKYFELLLNNSNNQIIWGGNYFLDYLHSTPSIIIWNKKNGSNLYSDAEIAWGSFESAVRMFNWRWHGFLQEKHGEYKQNRIHPTEKPIALYRWLLQNYATEGDTILDTHGGSMSLAIACYIEDFELDIIELDEDYYKDAVKRFEQHISQKTLF